MVGHFIGGISMIDYIIETCFVFGIIMFLFVGIIVLAYVVSLLLRFFK